MKRILLAESVAVMPLAFEGFGVKNKSFPIIGSSVTGIELALVPCITLEAAKAIAYDGIDLVLCGLHFDESRMFDFLRFMKADPTLKSIPFVCIKAIEGKLEPTYNESIRIATQALGADGFFDLWELNKKLGREDAVHKIRLYIDRIIGKSEDF